MAAMKRAATSLKRAGHFRNVKIVLKEPLVNEYIDEAENFIFKEHILEEIVPSSIEAFE